MNNSDTRYRLISVNVGKPVTVEYNGKPLTTGIHKQPVEGTVFIGRVQMTGDGQADLKNHGGPDKAVCAYPVEHYAYWEQELGKTMGDAAFGENLTMAGLLETEVCIGDQWEIGEAIVQISQPRFPCFKLVSKHGVTDLPARVLDKGYSGFYFRVLQEGSISAESSVKKLTSHPMQVNVASVLHQLALGRKHADRAQLQRMVQVDALADSVKNQFTDWLNQS